MNILIIESEIYLAQKIVARLVEDGHHCDSIEFSDFPKLTKDYDIVLLSTALPYEFCKKVIKKYKIHSIILLLVSYPSDETVTIPIKEGAKDYIMKPFVMEELIRKIYHYKECQNLRKELKTLKRYIKFIMSDVNIEHIPMKSSFPFLIESKSQRHSDKLVIDFSKKLDLGIRFISLSSDNWQDDLDRCSHRNIAYLTDFHTLKKNIKEQVMKAIENRKCIVSSLDDEDDFIYQKVKINDSDLLSPDAAIMTINDYVKNMVLSYQSKYPDTELSKKLGISRKSLWERRKKLGIEKKGKKR